MTHLTPPPRHVPLTQQIVMVFNGLTQIGWFVFGFGSIFFWGFAMRADYSFLDFRTPQTVTGKIVSVEATNAKENKTVIIKNHFEYSVDGRLFQGQSYSTGQTTDPGERVSVEYLPDHPEKSRVAGMRRDMFSPFASFVTIFPLIGAAIVFFSMRSAWRRSTLLRDGILANGVLKEKRPTNMTVNRRPVWELVFEFTTRDGQRARATARTSMTERLTDEREEQLLYDPQNPSRAYLLDEVPSRPDIDETGQFRARPIRAFAAILLPAIVIAANLLAAAYH